VNAAIHRVEQFGVEKMVSDRPDAMLWLFNSDTYVVTWHVCQADLVYATF